MDQKSFGGDLHDFICMLSLEFEVNGGISSACTDICAPGFMEIRDLSYVSRLRSVVNCYALAFELTGSAAFCVFRQLT